MIQIRAASGETVSASATVVGGIVAVVSISCRERATAEAFAAACERRLLRLAARQRARTPARPAQPPADPFPAGAPVQARVWEWHEGEMMVDATILARLSETRLTVRTAAGNVIEVDQRDLEPGANGRGDGVWPYVRHIDAEDLG